MSVTVNVRSIKLSARVLQSILWQEMPGVQRPLFTWNCQNTTVSTSRQKTEHVLDSIMGTHRKTAFVVLGNTVYMRPSISEGGSMRSSQLARYRRVVTHFKLKSIFRFLRISFNHLLLFIS